MTKLALEEDTMDYGWISHAFVWLIGAMTLVAVVGTVGALFSMGRSAYRKD